MSHRFSYMLCILLSLLCLGGCSAPQEPPGKLVSVQYDRVNPTIYGDDYGFTVIPNEIVAVYTLPPPEYGSSEYATFSHIPITGEDWASIERMVMELYPKLRKGGSVSRESANDSQILDGGDETSLVLTWDCSGTQRRIAYHVPPCDTVVELVQTVKDLSQPAIHEVLQQEVIP